MVFYKSDAYSTYVYAFVCNMWYVTKRDGTYKHCGAPIARSTVRRTSACVTSLFGEMSSALAAVK